MYTLCWFRLCHYPSSNNFLSGLSGAGPSKTLRTKSLSLHSDRGPVCTCQRVLCYNPFIIPTPFKSTGLLMLALRVIYLPFGPTLPFSPIRIFESLSLYHLDLDHTATQYLLIWNSVVFVLSQNLTDALFIFEDVSQ